jgi:tRNA modification GTPase
MSGPRAVEVAQAILQLSLPLTPRHATFARLASDGTGSSPLDEVVVTWFPEPRSYTGQHVVEISAHGSPVVLDAIVRAAMTRGARLARPGEFTLRAFLNGKRDLVQAEAVADLIAAATPLQARVASEQLEGALSRKLSEIERAIFDLVVQLEASLDFPDEGYHFIQPGEIVTSIDQMLARADALLADAVRGRMIREGATVVVAGRANVGKSSVFNALVGAERAIVTDVPGTTRDLITERLDIVGLEITLVDTAGARDTFDRVEREGVTRAADARSSADLVLLVVDGSEPLTGDDRRLIEATSAVSRLLVVNKCDRPRQSDTHAFARAAGSAVCDVSALTHEGIDGLRTAIVRELTGIDESWRDTVSISNARHIALVTESRVRLMAARAAASTAATPEECLLVDLHAARACFDEILGARSTEDLLEQVFARFCIGK